MAHNPFTNKRPRIKSNIPGSWKIMNMMESVRNDGKTDRVSLRLYGNACSFFESWRQTSKRSEFVKGDTE